MRIMQKSPIKSCIVDSISAKLLRNIAPALAAIITMVNLSTQTASFPQYMKEAIISPILKKSHLDIQFLNNYWPVSNLPYVSKAIKRLVASQHIECNSLGELLSSAYKQYHSTKTALTYVINDNLLSLHRKQSVFLVLLEISAAFNVGHQTPPRPSRH